MSTELTWMRDRLGRRLSSLKPVEQYQRPHKGWLAAIREVLGMTAAQCGQRMGISRVAVSKIEKGEREKTIQLQTLEKAAAAVGCELVYMLVPKTSLEEFMETQAKRKARHHYQSVAHSMALEAQGLEQESVTSQLDQIVNDLMRNPKGLWSIPVQVAFLDAQKPDFSFWL